MAHWKGCAICGPNWFHKWWCPRLSPWVEIVAIGSVILAAVNVLGPTEPGSGWPLALAVIAIFVPLAVSRRLWAGERSRIDADGGDPDPLADR